MEKATWFLLAPLLLPIAIAYYNRRQDKKQKTSDWSRDKHTDLYTRATAHYTDHDRFTVIDDWPSPMSQKLISEAKLLNVPFRIIDLMEEEEMLRTNPGRMNPNIAPDVLLWSKAQDILRAMQQDMQERLNGLPLMNRLLNPLNTAYWRFYDFRTRRLKDPLFLLIYMLPTVGLILPVGLLVLLYFRVIHLPF